MSLSRTLQTLCDAYEAKHFSEDIFDLDAGFLQTSVENNDDRMPLKFFVDYNNIWWFPLLRAVEVYHSSIDDASGSGSIAFTVQYGDARSVADTIHGMQYLRFNEFGQISYIRTFANPSFWIDNPHPSVQLDAIGNHIWLGSGYRMDRSVQMAIEFLDESPEAATFRELDRLKPQIAQIRKNLDFYQSHNGTQWEDA